MYTVLVESLHTLIIIMNIIHFGVLKTHLNNSLFVQWIYQQIH